MRVRTEADIWKGVKEFYYIYLNGVVIIFDKDLLRIKIYYGYMK
jgi:hypothetical protein